MKRCIITGCPKEIDRYDICHGHFYLANLALRKTLVFLYKEGARIPGYENALQCAKREIEDSLKPMARVSENQVGRARGDRRLEEEEEPRPHTARPILVTVKKKKKLAV